MGWIALFAVLAGILIFWLLPTRSTRYRYLLAGTLLLSSFMTWQWLPGLDQHPLDRLALALGLASANVALVAVTIWVAQRVQRGQRSFIWLGLAVLIGLFILSKWTEAWATLQLPLAQLLDNQTDTAIPAGAWLGLSYLLFRLLHVLFESRHGQLPDLKFGAMVVYALFPASLIAGPIDRFPRFKTDLDQVGQRFKFDFVAEGTWRILIGAFKKFVIADFLVKLPIDLTQYPNKTPLPYLWLALYAYGFYLFFDFSGYTDMALGVARLLGFRLPENFDGPYLKTNLARFWQAWHITLSSWARDYVFLPLARTLRSKAAWLPMNGAVLACHLATMLVIGLWHGFAWTFVAWGLWHGVGLFAVKLWGDFTRSRRMRPTRWSAALGLLLTFNFVMLGWVFFTTRDLSTALQILGRLFGIQ